MMTKLDKSTSFQLNVIRACAIILVLIMQTTTYYTMIHSNTIMLKVNLGLNNISQIAVPIFVFLSGYTLSINYKNSNKREFYWKRIKRLGVPYIVGTIILGVYFYMSAQVSLSNIKYNLLHSSACYHFWYFKLIFQLYIVYPFIVKVYDKYANKQVINTSLLMIQITYNLIMIMSCYMFNRLNICMNVLNGFNYIFYFGYGIYCRKCNEGFLKVKSKESGQNGLICLYLLSILIQFVLRYYGLIQNEYLESIEMKYYVFIRIMEPIQTLLSIEVIKILACKWINEGESRKFTVIDKISKTISNQSLYIYIYHALIIDVLIRVLSKKSIYANQYKYYVVLFLGTLLICVITGSLFNKLPIISEMLGMKRKKVVMERNGVKCVE